MSLLLVKIFNKHFEYDLGGQTFRVMANRLLD